MPEELVLQDEPARVPPQVLLRQYAELIRKQSAVHPEPVRLPNMRRPLYVLAALGIVATYAAAVGLLLQPAVIPGARPPAAVLAVESQDACAQRQTAILQAIAAYRRDHGEAPGDLETLIPQYLAVPATDPASGSPYDYTRQGSGVILTCPNPDAH